MDIPRWLLHSFGYESSNLPTDPRAEFIKIRHDEEMSDYFERQGYLKACTHLRRRYPASWPKVEQLLITFPTTWHVESGFSVVARMMTKQRNRLLITTSGDLRLRLTNLQPKFGNLECLNINDNSIS